MPGKKRSEFLTHEDWWAIWIGFALIFAGFIIYLFSPPEEMDDKITKANTKMEEEAGRAPFRTVEWFLANDSKEKIKATGSSQGKTLKKFLQKPHKWKDNPLRSFILSDEQAEEIAVRKTTHYNDTLRKEEAIMHEALELQAQAESAGFKDDSLNAAAKGKIMQWRSAQRASAAAKKSIPKAGYNQLFYLLVLGLILAVVFGIGMQVMNGSLARFIPGFMFIFLFAVISYMIANQVTMKELGLGYAIWAITIGLIISNTVGTPKWVIPAVQTEYFIKTGLVLLGAELLFGKIVQIGIPGLMVAWIVTPVVILVSFTLGRKYIKMESNELNITMSSAVSVCGVSAAIATAAACKAKKEELTLAVGLSLIFTAIMMVLMPAFIKWAGISEILGGAWMGGVIDSTGAVAAAGAFLGEKALYVAATIKMIQNILIGVVAFFVAIYWTMKFDMRESGTKPNAMEIWYRFPKFVIGFALASVFTSLVAYSIGPDKTYVLIDHGVIGGFTKDLRGWMFCLAFVSIGLSTNFKELKSYFKGGKPFTLYVFGQTFNLLLTLLIAWLAFYVIFPYITEAI